MSVTEIAGQRVLCLGDVRGRLSTLNDLATAHRATVIVCAGTFGFFDEHSRERLSPNNQTLATTLMSEKEVNGESNGESNGDSKSDNIAQEQPLGTDLSDLPLFLAKRAEFKVPVYCTPGSSDDVEVVNKFLSGEYSVENLNVLNEVSSFFLDAPEGEARIHLFGLGGKLDLSSLFDVGTSKTSTPGNQNNMWIGLWQMGQLISHLQGVWDPKDVHVFVTHSPVTLNPLLQYFSLISRADITISSGLHFRHSVSTGNAAMYAINNDWISVLNEARADLHERYISVRDGAVARGEALKPILNLGPVERLLTEPPTAATTKFLYAAYHNQWHWNLCSIESGALVLAFNGDRLASETVSAGFCYGSRRKVEGPLRKGQFPNPEDVIRKGKKLLAGQKVSKSSDKESDKNSDQSAEKDSDKVSDKVSDKISDKISDKASDKGSDQGADDAPKSKVKPTPPKRESSKPKGKTSTAADNNEPGLWFRDGQKTEQEILDTLHEEDRANVTKVLFKETNSQRPDGMQSKFCTVFFNTAEQAATAYERVDKEKAGTVAIRNPHYRQQQHYHRNQRSYGKFGFRHQ